MLLVDILSFLCVNSPVIWHATNYELVCIFIVAMPNVVVILVLARKASYLASLFVAMKQISMDKIQLIALLMSLPLVNTRGCVFMKSEKVTSLVGACGSLRGDI